MDQKSPMSKYWMPLVWATNIINTARKQELITSDHIVQTLLVELSDIRRRLGALIGYDTVCVPLVYTQVSWRFYKKKKLCFYLLIIGGYTGLIHLLHCGTAWPPNDTESWLTIGHEIWRSGSVFSTIHRITGNIFRCTQYRINLEYAMFMQIIINKDEIDFR